MKQHIARTILEGLDNSTEQAIDSAAVDLASKSVFFKHDRIYSHKIFRVNYTAYDVRRAQDVLNPDTSHCNIMVFNREHNIDISSSNMPFLYGRILGVYHANIVYTGPGSLGYQPERIDFLWVRWYEQVDASRTGWSARKLDRLRFTPVSVDGAFGFLDPSAVLRACHIIPVFRHGKRYEGGKGMSFQGRDSDDWKEYYISR